MFRCNCRSACFLDDVLVLGRFREVLEMRQGGRQVSENCRIQAHGRGLSGFVDKSENSVVLQWMSREQIHAGPFPSCRSSKSGHSLPCGPRHRTPHTRVRRSRRRPRPSYAICARSWRKNHRDSAASRDAWLKPMVFSNRKQITCPVCMSGYRPGTRRGDFTFRAPELILPAAPVSWTKIL